MLFRAIIELRATKMFLVGLTGGIASGKSTVSKMLVDMGCPVLDADIIAREVVEYGKPAWKKIQKAFGPEVFHEDGTLNREALGQIVFADDGKRRLLNSIVHPQIYKSLAWKIFQYFVKGTPFVILDLPLLFESGQMLPYMSYIVVVNCSERKQLQRLMQRNSYSQEEAMQRINAQMPLTEKCKGATQIIDNSGDRDHTTSQVIELHQNLRQSWKHWQFRAWLLMGLFGMLLTFRMIWRFFIPDL